MSKLHRFDIEQHTPEWYDVRSGQWTGSVAAVIMGGLDTKGLSDLIKTIAWERVFGTVNEPRYQSSAMARGNEVEEEARNWAIFNSNEPIITCGYVHHPTVKHVGWSPDGLVAPSYRSAVEVKCLLHKAYMDVMFKREVPSEYRWQTRWALWTGDLDLIDFVVYHPKPGGLVIPVERDRSFDDQMEARVYLLESRVQETIERINDFRRVA